MKYTELTFTELVNKIGSSRFFDLPSMLKEAFTRLANTPSGDSRPYKVYTAEFDQTQKQTINSGTLVPGVKYFIPFISVGDDFTNLGADGNYDWVEFIATGTTPSVWTNGTPLYFNYDPIVTILENTLGSLELVTNNPGHYRYNSELIVENKTQVFNSTSLSGDLNPTEMVKTFTDGNNVFIELYRVFIDGLDLNYSIIPLYEKFTIEIRVYN